MLNDPKIPASRTAMVDDEASPTRVWFQFFSAIYRYAQKGYGSFSTSSSQSALANVPTAIEFTTTGAARSCEIGSPASRVYVSREGAYSLGATLVFTSTTLTTDSLIAWFAVNGVGVEGSTCQIPVRKLTGPTTWLSSASFEALVTLVPTDYVEVYWMSSAGSVNLTPVAASSSPSYPASSSASLIINQVV